jgi:ribosomal protein S18 acetylase RimI-like enzyme
VALLIRPFDPGDQKAARQLILTGLGGHFGWIDESCDPDLDDILATCVRPDHLFVVAEEERTLVGTGGLVYESATRGRIVRVSVDAAHRRRGIGRALTACLLEAARQGGLRQAVVSTNYDWEDAIGLYRARGFAESGRDEWSVYLSLPLGG